MKQLFKIFPVSFQKTNIEETNTLKEKYLNKIKESYYSSPSVPFGWSTTKIHTSFSNEQLNDLIFGNGEFPKDLYFKYINLFFDTDWEADIIDYWFNCYIDGDYQEQHNHCNQRGAFTPQFSCIHYLSFDPTRHHPVSFCDPLAAARASSLEMDFYEYDPLFTPEVNEGDFLMFPSWLDHFVRPSEPTPDYPRITISFNLSVYGYGSK